MILVIYLSLLQSVQISMLKKTIQISTITAVDSCVNVSLETLIEQQTAISLNIDNLTITFYDQLKNLISIINDNVNAEQTSRGSILTSSEEQSLVVKTRHKETRKMHPHEVSSLEDSHDSDENYAPTHKSPRINSHDSCVQSSTAAA